MTCQQLEPYVVDLAREQVRPNAEADKHLRVCESCAAILERERALTAALRRLAPDVREAAPKGEAAVLAAFDASWAARRPRSTIAVPAATGLAAVVLLSVWLMWPLPTNRDVPALTPVPSAPASIDGAAPSIVFPPPEPTGDARARTITKPPREAPLSGRVQLSSGTAGRTAPGPAGSPGGFVPWPGADAWPPFESGELIRVELAFESGVVEADVLIGQDGFARAVRLIE